MSLFNRRFTPAYDILQAKKRAGAPSFVELDRNRLLPQGGKEKQVTMKTANGVDWGDIQSGDGVWKLLGQLKNDTASAANVVLSGLNITDRKSIKFVAFRENDALENISGNPVFNNTALSGSGLVQSNLVNGWYAQNGNPSVWPVSNGPTQISGISAFSNLQTTTRILFRESPSNVVQIVSEQLNTIASETVWLGGERIFKLASIVASNLSSIFPILSIGVNGLSAGATVNIYTT